MASPRARRTRSTATSNPTGLVGMPVTITIANMVALLDPPVAAIEALLTSTRRRFELDVAGRCRDQATQAVLWLHDHKGRLAFPAGLGPRVADFLQARGGVVTVTDQRAFGAEHTLDLAVATSVAQQELLKTLAREPLGQIEMPKREVPSTVVLLCRAFPRARTIVAVPTRKLAWRYHRLLRAHFGHAVGLATGGTCDLWTRLTVATYAYLGGLSSRPTHLVLLPDPLSVTGGAAKGGLARLGIEPPRRVYAFLPPGLKLGPAGQLALEAVSGPVLYRRGPAPAKVLVQVAEAPSLASTAGLSGLAWKQAAYWINPGRNDRLAALAMALAQRDLPGLWALGLLLEAPETVLPPPQVPFGVVVLVESLAHGRQLLARLPGWQLLGGLEGQIRDGTATEPAGRIVTLAYASTHALDIHALVVGGGEGPVDLPGFPPPQDKVPGGTAVLIDLADAFDTQARQAFRRRREAYSRRGWIVTPAAGVAMTPITIPSGTNDTTSTHGTRSGTTANGITTQGTMTNGTSGTPTNGDTTSHATPNGHPSSDTRSATTSATTTKRITPDATTRTGNSTSTNGTASDTLASSAPGDMITDDTSTDTITNGTTSTILTSPTGTKRLATTATSTAPTPDHPGPASREQEQDASSCQPQGSHPQGNDSENHLPEQDPIPHHTPSSGTSPDQTGRKEKTMA